MLFPRSSTSGPPVVSSHQRRRSGGARRCRPAKRLASAAGSDKPPPSHACAISAQNRPGNGLDACFNAFPHRRPSTCIGKRYKGRHGPLLALPRPHQRHPAPNRRFRPAARLRSGAIRRGAAEGRGHGRPRLQRGNGFRQGGQGAFRLSPRPRRRDRRRPRREPRGREGRGGGAGLHQHPARAILLLRCIAQRPGCAANLRAAGACGARQGEYRICLGQSYRADARRPRTRRGFRRRARQSHRIRGSRGRARILRQRRRRPGRRARALRLSALPRGAGRDDRHSRGALPRRLSEVGRRCARAANTAIGC